MTIQVIENRFHLSVFNIFKESSKQYVDFPLSGRLETDRREIHRLADLVQKDLFKVMGIASLKIIYAKNRKS